MKVSKTIIISKEEILEYFICEAESCTIREAKEIVKKATISYDIKESGDYDKGNYTRELNEIEIAF